MKIGLLCEEKRPPDKRVPFAPAQIQSLGKQYPAVEFCIQPSSLRCFKDEEYQAAGIPLQEDLSDCDVLFGIKEVPPERLLANKTYVFFSHTAKKQPYNRHLLQQALAQNIRLIDYEYLTDSRAQRIVAFGRFAGIVGAHHALRAYGLRSGAYALPRAVDCQGQLDLFAKYEALIFPSVRVLITGTGRVGQGAAEVLDAAGFEKCSPKDFLSPSLDPKASSGHDSGTTPRYAQLNSLDYNTYDSPAKDSATDLHQLFYTHPQRFSSSFLPYAQQADILIAGAYWSPQAPRLFTPEEAAAPTFRLRVISDITCDINGSIPATKRPSTIQDPLYGYDPQKDCECELPQTWQDSRLTICAVDNLPCELPVDASLAFGHQLERHVMPALCGKGPKEMLERATIAQQGKLGSAFRYLSDFVDGA